MNINAWIPTSLGYRTTSTDGTYVGLREQTKGGKFLAWNLFVGSELVATFGPCAGFDEVEGFLSTYTTRSEA